MSSSVAVMTRNPPRQRYECHDCDQRFDDLTDTACQKAGYTSWRDRLLNPAITVQLFLLQILHNWLRALKRSVLATS
jgi:hypothetical protein